MHVPAKPARFGIAAQLGSTWLRVSSAARSDNPWDDAHGILEPGAPSRRRPPARRSKPSSRIFEQSWAWSPKAKQTEIAADAADRCVFVNQDNEGGKAMVRRPHGILATYTAN